MARGKRAPEEEPELNLAPIMNMVVILIPMLLLSVVFLKVGVINVTAPPLAVGAPSEPKEQEEKPLDLTVAVSATGFRIAAEGGILPENPGCPVPGPTICLADQKVDVMDEVKKARARASQGDIMGGEEILLRAMAAYDWPGLYTMLAQTKKKFPNEKVVKVTADPDIPYAMIIRVIDVARFRLEKDKYAKVSDFWLAPYKKAGNNSEEMFPDPVFAIAQ